jgi:hypothetical protein
VIYPLAALAHSLNLHINFRLGILLCIVDCSKACACAFRLFYQQEAGNYNMPEATLRIGQYCVALYNKEWHRACITALHNLVEVQVRLQIDVVLLGHIAD